MSFAPLVSAACRETTAPENLTDLQENVPVSGAFAGWRWTGGASLGEVILFEGWSEVIDNPDIDLVNNERQVRINGIYFHDVVVLRHQAATPTIGYSGLGHCRRYTLAIRNITSCVRDPWRVFRFTTLRSISITTHPQDAEICLGGTTTLLAAGSGTPDPDYQWFCDGSPVPGGIRPILQVAGAPGGVRQYFCRISNRCGPADTRVATVIVRTPPATTSEPADATLCLNQTVPLTFGVVADPAPSYQWFCDGIPVPGATGPTLTVAANAPGVRRYFCRASNPCGSVDSRLATVVMQTGPTITCQPQDVTVCVGGSVEFRVCADGNPAPTYQWFCNGSPIPGATGPNLRVSADQGGTRQYFCRVSNPCGTVNSLVATLTICTPPIITCQPANATICVGAPAEFTVCATAVCGMTYQWFCDGSPVDGATGATLRVQGDQGGMRRYFCRISNRCGTVDSATATLTICTRPIITCQPRDARICVGESAEFTVCAEAACGVEYQWFRDGSLVPGATSATLRVRGDQRGTQRYFCQVSNRCGTVDSSSATLQVDACKATITGFAWNDVNTNGVKETAEPFHPGVEVYLDINNNGHWDPQETLVSTDAQGNYTFSDLEFGKYFVRERDQPGYFEVAPGPRGDHLVCVDAVNSTGRLNFGNKANYQFTAPRRQGNVWEINFGADIGRRFRIFISQDLCHWVPLTNIVGTNFHVTIRDVRSPGVPHRFYKAVATDAPSVLLGWWSGNNTAVDTASGRLASLQNGVTYGDGKVGRCFAFDGIDDYIDCGAEAAIVGRGPFAAELWVAARRSPATLISQRDAASANGEWEVELRGGRIGFYTFGDGAYGFDLISNRRIDDGQFHHVAVVREASGRGRIYIDGQLDSEQDAPARTLVPLRVVIGADLRSLAIQNFGEYFQGRLDEVTLYNKALSAEQVLEIYRAGSAGKCGP